MWLSDWPWPSPRRQSAAHNSPVVQYLRIAFDIIYPPGLCRVIGLDLSFSGKKGMSDRHSLGSFVSPAQGEGVHYEVRRRRQNSSFASARRSSQSTYSSICENTARTGIFSVLHSPT